MVLNSKIVLKLQKTLLQNKRHTGEVEILIST